MPEEPSPALSTRSRVIVAWIGAAVTLVAVVGLIAAPAARVVWIVLLIFGIATIPQVLLFTGRQTDSENRERG